MKRLEDAASPPRARARPLALPPVAEEEGWEAVEVKADGGASSSGKLSSSTEMDMKLAQLAPRRMAHRAAVKHLAERGIACGCHVAAKKEKEGARVGKQTHASQCAYIVGYHRLTKGH